MKTVESLEIKTIALSLPGWTTWVNFFTLSSGLGFDEGENDNTYAIVVITKTNEHKSDSFTSYLGEIELIYYFYLLPYQVFTVSCRQTVKLCLVYVAVLCVHFSLLCPLL